jgi:Spy/CpxP family protein refolding chaperone
MARNIAWVVAALLLVPASGRAAGHGDIAVCDREQPPQQRGGHPATAAKPDPAAPKSDKDKPGSPRPERPKWWIDAKLRAELGITDQQSAAVEAVWQKSLPALREGREKLEKLEDALSKLTDGNDEAAVIAQTERVESMRAELNKGRTLMIYRMHRLLKPEQRAKVRAMFEQPSRRSPAPGKS